jgi:hypothetical protein
MIHRPATAAAASIDGASAPAATAATGSDEENFYLESAGRLRPSAGARRVLLHIDDEIRDDDDDASASEATDSCRARAQRGTATTAATTRKPTSSASTRDRR